MKLQIWNNLITVVLLSLFLFSCGEKESSPNADSAVSNVKEPQEQAQGSPFQEGQDYVVLDNPYETDSPNKIVVYEFFGYTCPHCFHFEPFIEPWALSKSESVSFQKIPLNFHASWSVYQQGYLTAQTMGIADQAHTALFEAIHKDNKRFNSIEGLAAWYADVTGVDKDKFISTADSFIIDANQSKADGMGFQMQVTGTPTVVVDGKYKIAPKKNRQDEINVLRYLIDKRAQEKGLELTK